MRIDLAGHGTPIPTVGIPELGGETPTLTFFLEDGVPFVKADYEAVGYNVFEVWCIGGAGGKGGDDGGDRPSWHYTSAYEVATPEIWEQVLELYDQTAHDSGVTYYIYNGVQVTPRQLAELQNPSHTMTVTVYHDPVMGDLPVTGGGGGGGGLHYVSGMLADIPDSVPVLVGKAGADALPGQTSVDGLLDGVPQPPDSLAPSWFNRYPDVHPMFDVPQRGEDGGTSAFGDIAMASGGKGGHPRTAWVDGVRTSDGVGGEGGTGGRMEAGGGGAGGVVGIWDNVLGDNAQSGPGQDGSWDGSIGQGGGGGGGGQYVHPQFPFFPNPSTVYAGQGGRGSFSYSDTTVYGPGQDHQPFSVQPGGLTALIIPGGGGGARLKGQGYGSRAPSYSPDGVVMIRLAKID